MDTIFYLSWTFLKGGGLHSSWNSLLANGYVHFYCVVGSTSLRDTQVGSNRLTSISWILWLFLENWDWFSLCCICCFLKWRDYVGILKLKQWTWEGGWLWKVGLSLHCLMAFPMETCLWVSYPSFFFFGFMSLGPLGYILGSLWLIWLTHFWEWQCRMEQRYNLSQWHCRSMCLQRMEEVWLLQLAEMLHLRGKALRWDARSHCLVHVIFYWLWYILVCKLW